MERVRVGRPGLAVRFLWGVSAEVMLFWAYGMGWIAADMWEAHRAVSMFFWACYYMTAVVCGVAFWTLVKESIRDHAEPEEFDRGG